MAAISPKSNTIPIIIRSYKSAVTKHANRLGLPNGWQPRFYDHIIRNDAEYQRISDYIVNNPANWQTDKFYAPSPPP
ncbi:transposase [Haliscomenobacter sp.]|uniref:transposase n=1 Tax=Haliscomenobacter sp. TaxID=2717303 RepID=UPI003BAB5C84